jgi:hypothetical protein
MSYRASAVKSVQRGSISLLSGSASATATITAVNTSYSYVQPVGATNYAGSSDEDGQVRLELTNSTTVTAYHKGASLSSVTMAFQVFEFFPWALRQAVQQGTISHTAPATTNTATITAVGSKAQLIYLGTSVSTDAADTYPLAAASTLELTNSTTITATRPSGSSSDVVIGYVAVDPK